jgi:hypothetical protein
MRGTVVHDRGRLCHAREAAEMSASFRVGRETRRVAQPRFCVRIDGIVVARRVPGDEAFAPGELNHIQF